MQSKTLRFKKGFRVALQNQRGQAAEMTIAPGDSEGGPENAHRGADQWLFVVGGKGVAIGSSRRVTLREGTLLLIRKGEHHEIRNTGHGNLQTLVFYTPPAYRASGARLPRARP